MTVVRGVLAQRRRLLLCLLVGELVLAAFGLTTPSPVPGRREPSSAEVDAVRAQLYEETRSVVPDLKDVALAASATTDDWALLTLRVVTDADDGAEGIVVIGRREGAAWHFVRQGDPTFEVWLEALPAQLLSKEEKEWLR